MGSWVNLCCEDHRQSSKRPIAKVRFAPAASVSGALEDVRLSKSRRGNGIWRVRHFFAAIQRAAAVESGFALVAGRLGTGATHDYASTRYDADARPTEAERLDSKSSPR